jgi:DNA-binding ferritin-like protein
MKPEEFAFEIMMMRDVVHLTHLKTTSYAAHKALGDLYDSLTDHFDDFVETVQGDGGLLEIKGKADVKASDDVIDALDEFCEKIKEMKAEYSGDMAENGHLVNMLEDITTSVKHALYKLKFLA